MTPKKEDLARRIAGALGEIKADLIVSGGKLINVYSGEILEGVEIALLDGRICCVAQVTWPCAPMRSWKPVGAL